MSTANRRRPTHVVRITFKNGQGVERTWEAYAWRRAGRFIIDADINDLPAGHWEIWRILYPVRRRVKATR